MNPSTIKTNWRVPFACAISAMMTMQMSSLGFSPLLPAIQKDFAISFSQMGLFTGMYGLIAMVVSLPGDRLAQRFGEKRILVAGFSRYRRWTVMAEPGAELRLGTGGARVVAGGLSPRLRLRDDGGSAHRAGRLASSAMGILGAFSSLASVIVAPFGSLLEKAFGWRQGILGFGVMAGLGLLVFSLGYHRTEEAASGGVVYGHGAAARSSAPPSGRHGVPLRTSRGLGHGSAGACEYGGFQRHFLRALRREDHISASPYRCGFHHQHQLHCGHRGELVDRISVRPPESLACDDRPHAGPLIPSTFAMTTHNLLPLPLCHGFGDFSGSGGNESDLRYCTGSSEGAGYGLRNGHR